MSVVAVLVTPLMLASPTPKISIDLPAYVHSEQTSENFRYQLAQWQTYLRLTTMTMNSTQTYGYNGQPSDSDSDTDCNGDGC